MKRFFIGLLTTPLVCFLAVAPPTPAEAALVLDIHRVDDRVGLITGTGFAPIQANNLTLLGGATSLGDNTQEGFSGDLSLGGQPVRWTRTLAHGTEHIIRFDNTFFAGSGFAGSLYVYLTSETWAPAGASGAIVRASDGAALGTWNMSVVPLPGAAWLLLGGLAALGLLSRPRALSA